MDETQGLPDVHDRLAVRLRPDRSRPRHDRVHPGRGRADLSHFGRQFLVKVLLHPVDHRVLLHTAHHPHTAL